MDFVPDSIALLLSFVGAGLALITGWIGGGLVYRLGVAVDPGAHVDGPNSIRTESATATRTKRTANR